MIHFARMLHDDYGLNNIRARVVKPLRGLKIATHPGCHYVRPSTLYPGFLRAAPCCRTEPGQDRSTAPATLAASAAGSSAPVKVALATHTAPAAASTDVMGSLTPAQPGATSPPLSLPHISVLRL